MDQFKMEAVGQLSVCRAAKISGFGELCAKSASLNLISTFEVLQAAFVTETMPVCLWQQFFFNATFIHKNTHS